MGKQVSCLIVAAIAVILTACDPTPIEPGNFEYPIQLTVEARGSVPNLSWDEVRVSTFEEYIIVRSTQPIDDTSEPETGGFAVIAARIDDLSVTTFEDNEAPVSTEFYYKVYAKFSDRFVYSPTVFIEIDLQLIPMRTDNFVVDTENDVIIGYDRSLRVLFAYNYKSAKILRQAAIVYNNPIIRFGSYQGKDEIYLCDHDNYIRILDRNTLQMWNEIYSNMYIHDFQYSDGYFFATRNSTSAGMAVFDRATLFTASVEQSQTPYYRLVATTHSGGNLRAFELAGTHLSRFTVDNGTIKLDRIVHETNNISQTQVAYSADLGHFAYSSIGNIYNEDLEVVATLDGGGTFHQVQTYTPDGSRLFTVSFDLNNPVIRTYATDEDYKFVSKRRISYTPTLLFADEGFLYAVGNVFINNATRTIITTEQY